MYLEMAADTGLFPEFLPHIIPLDDEQGRSERILVIVSFEENLNIHFKQLHSIHDAITVIVADDDFEPAAMLKSWGEYDQVFITGHGEDKSENYEGHIRLGKKILTPTMISNAVNDNAGHPSVLGIFTCGMIADALKAKDMSPSVLGIFTCGEAFYGMEARNHFDYFIADHQSSVARFVEMFLYGYLLSHFKSYNVLQSFKVGRMSTIFRAKSDPTYKIFTRGVKLHE